MGKLLGVIGRGVGDLEQACFLVESLEPGKIFETPWRWIPMSQIVDWLPKSTPPIRPGEVWGVTGFSRRVHLAKEPFADGLELDSSVDRWRFVLGERLGVVSDDYGSFREAGAEI